MADKNVFYIIGDDATARSKDLSALVDELLGTEDRSLCVETFDLADADSDETKARFIEEAVNSLSSPPFLTSLRIVVIRDIGAATSDNVAPLISYLENPLPTSRLVAVQGGGRISTLLTKAWKPMVTQRGSARESIADLFTKLTRESTLTFEPGVRDAILAHCGEDSSKLSDMIERLVSVFGAGTKLSLDDVSSYLGESGNVAFYELANEVCSGQTKRALEVVSRMLHSTSAENAKPMHPLQVISLLANHFRKLATVDDPSIRSQNDAFVALGSKGNPYGAKKSWEQARALGSVAILSCIEILGSIDVAVKGGSALEAQVTMELGIISLCQICDTHSGRDAAQIRNDFISALYV
ncbi:MAG TPA: hypothetical protein PKB15_07580 [Acidimicrobiia bacterium]|nr:hypothetical protein [Acidimicrobiia bacterium]